jgi:molybdenum-dependent DNA-binding transcriptional regulator ModE
MSNYKNGVSPKIIEMVQKINEVGVKELRTYYDKYKPRTNFRRQLTIVRAIAQKGYTTAAREYGISYQAAEQAIKRMYNVALEVEERKNNGKA